MKKGGKRRGGNPNEITVTYLAAILQGRVCPLEEMTLACTQVHTLG